MCVHFLCVSIPTNAWSFHLFTTLRDMNRSGVTNQTRPINPNHWEHSLTFGKTKEHSQVWQHNIGWWARFEDGKTCSSVLFLADQTKQYGAKDSTSCIVQIRMFERSVIIVWSWFTFDSIIIIISSFEFFLSVFCFVLHPFTYRNADGTFGHAMPCHGRLCVNVEMDPFKIVCERANEILTIRWLFIYVSFDAIRDQTVVLDFYQMEIGFSLIFTCRSLSLSLFHPCIRSITYDRHVRTWDMDIHTHIPSQKKIWHWLWLFAKQIKLYPGHHAHIQLGMWFSIHQNIIWKIQFWTSRTFLRNPTLFVVLPNLPVCECERAQTRTNTNKIHWSTHY